jgi:hypothetical protein
MKINQGIHCFIAVLIILFISFGLARASEAVQPVTNLFNDRAALEAFVDHLVTNRMPEAHVPGAVVSEHPFCKSPIRISNKVPNHLETV